MSLENNIRVCCEPVSSSRKKKRSVISFEEYIDELVEPRARAYKLDPSLALSLSETGRKEKSVLLVGLSHSQDF